MLKFDNFQGSPIIEGFDEYIDKVPVAAIGNGYSDGTKTYLEVYSEFLANEKMLNQVSTGLLEHMDAAKHCNYIKTISDNNNVEYYIQNNYLTDNRPVSIKNQNKSEYLTNTTKCPAVNKWITNLNGPLTSVDTSVRDISYAVIIANFGKNLSTDLSYIDILIKKSSNIIQDISKNYQNGHNGDYNTSVSRYNTNIKLRQELDMKMTELYNGDTSIAMYQKKSVDSVVYANVLWTILATSLIYYVFVKI